MEQEFLKAVSENQGIVLKVCRMYCSDSLEAEDLFQEILLQLWKSWKTFNADSKLSTWMYRISLNTAITRLRKSSRKPSFQGLSFAHEAIPESAPQRLDILFDKELQKAIESLDKLDKALVMLYLDEKSYRDISEILGLSEGNVAVKINRIKKKLKERIRR